MTSGDLYQREPMCYESLRSFDFNSFSRQHLDKPKSHRVTLHSSSIKMFPGFRSRCITFAEWMKLRAARQLYDIILMCSEVSVS